MPGRPVQLFQKRAQCWLERFIVGRAAEPAELAELSVSQTTLMTLPAPLPLNHLTELVLDHMVDQLAQFRAQFQGLPNLLLRAAAAQMQMMRLALPSTADVDGSLL